MNTRFIIVGLTLLALLTGLLAFTGCNTWKGAGKDIEKTGAAMQDE